MAMNSPIPGKSARGAVSTPITAGTMRLSSCLFIAFIKIFMAILQLMHKPNCCTLSRTISIIRPNVKVSHNTAIGHFGNNVHMITKVNRKSKACCTGAVSRLSAISADKLRIRERRYNAATPARTAGAECHYSAEVIDRSWLMKMPVDAGDSISSIAAPNDIRLQQRLRPNLPARLGWMTSSYNLMSSLKMYYEI